MSTDSTTNAARKRIARNVLISLVILATACARSDGVDETSAILVLDGATMGTTWSARLRGAFAASKADDLRIEIERILEDVDHVFSTYRSDSLVSRFNRCRSTDWQDVPTDVVLLVGACERLSTLSAGAFDATVGPLVTAWGFGAGGRRTWRPDAAAIAAARRHVGWRLLEHRQTPPGLRKVDPALEIDLSAIAKGHAVDRVGERLEALDVDAYLFEIGGEIRARGRRSSHEPWTVAIQRPDGPIGDARVIIRLEDASVATSGDYRNCFDERGVRRSHLIDPRSGEPVRHGLASVTVVDPSAAVADGLATMFFVLGEKEGFDLALRDDRSACFVSRRGEEFEVVATPRFLELVLEENR